MDPDVCDSDVDKGLHLPLPDPYTTKQNSEATFAMGRRVPLVLQHCVDDLDNHAVPTYPRSLGR